MDFELRAWKIVNHMDIVRAAWVKVENVLREDYPRSGFDGHSLACACFEDYMELRCRIRGSSAPCLPLASSAADSESSRALPRSALSMVDSSIF